MWIKLNYAIIKVMIYLDHAAATPMTERAIEAMLPFLTEQFYNPASPYLPAKHVREAYEDAKNRIAHAIGAKGADLVMTAGATESIALAFSACAHKCLILAIEHHAVIANAKKHPFEFIKVDKNGVIDLADFKAKLSDEVDFVSVALANNELGTIQPLAEIAEIIRAVRQKRLQSGNQTPIYLHSDASQAVNLLDINASRLGVDLLTINAPKCGGPKVVGALYVAHGVPLKPIVAGGGQEKGLRSGTENVAGAIAFATAIENAKTHLASNRKKYQQMAQIIRQELKNLPYLSIISQNNEKVNRKDVDYAENDAHFSQNHPENIPKTIKTIDKSDKVCFEKEKSYPEPIFLGNSKHQLASFVPVCFPGIDAERLIYKLENRGVLVSTGAACAANKGTKSHVLTAIGLGDTDIAGSLRVSLGSTNTLQNVKEAGRIIAEEVVCEYERLGYGK